MRTRRRPCFSQRRYTQTQLHRTNKQRWIHLTLQQLLRINLANLQPNDGSKSNYKLYKTTGWNFAIAQFINTLIITHSLHIVVIQEHWLLEYNLHKLSNCFDNFEVFAIPATKPASNKGRPSGGIAFIINNNICDKVKSINPPNSKRVSGISVNIFGES